MRLTFIVSVRHSILYIYRKLYQQAESSGIGDSLDVEQELCLLNGELPKAGELMYDEAGATNSSPSV